MTAYRCFWTAGEIVTPSLEGKPPIPNYTNTGGWVTIHTDTKDQAERIMLSLLPSLPPLPDPTAIVTLIVKSLLRVDML